MDLEIAWRGEKLRLRVRPKDASVVREVANKRCYARRGVELAKSRHWLDCGAHIGVFALTAAAEGCRVTAFEPHPENCELLRHNVAGKPVEVHQAALCDRDGEIELYLAPRSTSFHSLDPGKHGFVTVACRNFFDVLRDGNFDGVKMDVEGSEMPLLEGMLGTDLLAGVKQLVFEWDFKRDRNTARLRCVLDDLRRQGFAVSTHTHVFSKETWDHWPSGVLVYCIRNAAAPPDDEVPEGSTPRRS
jgi:FkbM family methyltransferase